MLMVSPASVSAIFLFLISRESWMPQLCPVTALPQVHSSMQVTHVYSRMQVTQVSFSPTVRARNRFSCSPASLPWSPHSTPGTTYIFSGGVCLCGIFCSYDPVSCLFTSECGFSCKVRSHSHTAAAKILDSGSNTQWHFVKKQFSVKLTKRNTDWNLFFLASSIQLFMKMSPNHVPIKRCLGMAMSDMPLITG